MTESIEALKEQKRYAQEYTEMLEKARELGVNDAALAELADGSNEAYEALKSITSGAGQFTEDYINELNEEYAATQAAKEAMAQAMAAAQTDVEDRAQAISDAVDAMVENADQATTAEEATKKTMDGLIAGIDAKLETLRGKVKEVNDLTDKLDNGSGGGSGPSHAAGLTYVPWDGYVAQLHRGEMVLTALEARAYRAEQFTNYGALARQETNTYDNRTSHTAQVNNTINFGDVYTRSEADLARLNRDMGRMMKMDNRLVGIRG